MPTLATLALAGFAFTFPATQATPPPSAPASAFETEALKTRFEFLNPGEFGKSASIASLLARDDVQGVAVAFVASSMGGFERNAVEIQTLHDSFRRRGVAIIVSVEGSAGTTSLKNTIAAKKITVPVSLTEKQWVTFGRVSGESGVNAWPWTFFVDENSRFVEISRSTPSASSLEAIAASESLPASVPGSGGVAPQDEPIPGLKPDAEAEAEQKSVTVGEITVNRPPLPLWRFEGESSGLGERILLAKPYAEDAAKPPGSVFEDAWGIEALTLLGRYEACVLVTTFDRGAHTGIGSMTVDPGSKVQLVDAHLALIQKHVKKTGKPKKNANASLGGVAASQLRVAVTADDGRTFDVTGYFVPLKAFTYAVWFLAPADASKALEKEIDEVRKGVKFSRGSRP